MPTYTFVCINCEKEVELWLSISKSDELQCCELCGSDLYKTFKTINVGDKKKEVKRKPGEYTKEFINEAKKELDDQRKELDEEYKL